MSARWRPTVLRVIGAVVAALLLVIVVGGVTEMFVGNGLAQWVRKTILIGSTLLVAGWVVGSRQLAPSAEGP